MLSYEGSESQIITLKKGTMFFRGFNFDPYDNVPHSNLEINVKDGIPFNPLTVKIQKTKAFFAYPIPFASFGIQDFGGTYRFHCIYTLTRDARILKFVKPAKKSRKNLRHMTRKNKNPGKTMNDLTLRCEHHQLCPSFDPSFTKYALKKTHGGIDGVLTIAGMDSISGSDTMKMIYERLIKIGITHLPTNSDNRKAFPEIISFEHDLKYCTKNNDKLKCDDSKLLFKPIIYFDLGQYFVQNIMNDRYFLTWNEDLHRYSSNPLITTNRIMITLMVKQYAMFFQNAWKLINNKMYIDPVSGFFIYDRDKKVAPLSIKNLNNKMKLATDITYIKPTLMMNPINNTLSELHDIIEKTKIIKINNSDNNNIINLTNKNKNIINLT